MSDPTDDQDEEVVEVGPKVSAKEGKDLDKVTGGDDDQEGKQVDVSKLSKAMEQMQVVSSSEAEAKAARQRALAAVKVKPEDVEAIVREFEITSEQADLALRENDGNLVTALRALIAA
eukprot:TRINITY_DN2444_c0_g1_i1.p1 TRINITY_DN2444_c0_g1~~TRINITY_DN2444_c0_g1_i1.p1  ORF type:complete len:118 (+),score=26.31 TRINITY_DN2444_c0_g1_i1:407-760(+)